MNKAGKVLVVIFVSLALLVSAGLIYTFVVGSNTEYDSEIEDATSQTTESTSANHSAGEVIWRTES